MWKFLFKKNLKTNSQIINYLFNELRSPLNNITFNINEIEFLTNNNLVDNSLTNTNTNTNTNKDYCLQIYDKVNKINKIITIINNIFYYSNYQESIIKNNYNIKKFNIIDLLLRCKSCFDIDLKLKYIDFIYNIDSNIDRYIFYEENIVEYIILKILHYCIIFSKIKNNIIIDVKLLKTCKYMYEISINSDNNKLIVNRYLDDINFSNEINYTFNKCRNLIEKYNGTFTYCNTYYNSYTINIVDNICDVQQLSGPFDTVAKVTKTTIDKDDDDCITNHKIKEYNIIVVDNLSTRRNILCFNLEKYFELSRIYDNYKDDNFSIIEDINESYIKTDDFYVTTTEYNNGLDLLYKVKDNLNKYNMIIIYNTIPYINGLFTTQLLRKIGYNNLIVGISDDENKNETNNFLSNGADYKFVKTITRDDIHNLYEYIEENGTKSKNNSMNYSNSISVI